MPDLSGLIREYAEKILLKCQELLPLHPNEAEFRQPIDQLLEEFLRQGKVELAGSCRIHSTHWKN
jgi:cytoskeletal protein RodZ